jgi:hypothetical protein
MATDLKTSVHVNRQLPEFIREDYPLFQSFLEAYYQFLETKQSGTDNDLLTRAKQHRYSSDVDVSIDTFEQQFIDTFISLFPKNTEVTKDFLIKNALPLYKSKGTENSFKLLFRMLFNEDVEYKRLSEDILKASDGVWRIENVLRLHKNITSVHQSNGSKTTFDLLYPINNGDIEVYVYITILGQTVLALYDPVNYFVEYESQLIKFNTALPIGEFLVVYKNFDNFDISILQNRLFSGQYSNASIIVERVEEDNFLDNRILSLFFYSKNYIGNFIRNETVQVSTTNNKNKNITLRFNSFSGVQSVKILEPGTNYNVGDQVTIIGGDKLSTAEVSSVDSNGGVQEIYVTSHGKGFLEKPLVNLNDYGDSNAVLEVVLTDIITTLPGNYHSEKGLLSSDSIRMQSQKYYHNYSYITTAKVEFDKYKNIFKSILHPAGFQQYANWHSSRTINSQEIIVNSYTSNTHSGTVSVSNGSVYVSGTNTNFNFATSTTIAINNEIRNVVSVVSSSNLEVDSAFTSNASGQEIILI